MWPNFRSPLVWDFFAISTYFTVSLIFWYIGLIPDLATMRDRSKTKARQIAYGIFALGWRGSNRHWQHYEMAYLLLAALATPLGLSVHSPSHFSSHANTSVNFFASTGDISPIHLNMQPNGSSPLPEHVPRQPKPSWHPDFPVGSEQLSTSS